MRNTSPSDGLELHAITIHDDKFGTITNCTPNVLPPGGTASCTAARSHTITQQDLNAGSILDTAHATGLTPNDDEVTSNEDQELVTGERRTGIEITKEGTPPSYSAPGQTITYRYTIYHYTVTNTGTVTLHNVRVSDDRITRLACTPPEGASLAPGAVMHCTATHVITQADVDRGFIANAATATSHPPTARR